MRTWILFALTILLFSACDTPMLTKAGEPFVDRIENGTIFMVDGRKLPIPGFGNDDQVTFFLVRHAEKSGEGGDDPKLSELGKARAEKLARILKKVPMNRICSTEYHRTRDTAGPLSFNQAVPMFYYPPREQDDYFKNYVTGGEGMNVLVVGHSNTIPALANYLIGQEKYQAFAHEAYDDFFVVISKGPNKGEVLELKY